jgi:putative hydrolase of the HAD superfamily
MVPSPLLSYIIRGRRTLVIAFRFDVRGEYTDEMTAPLFIFDLDNTLYPKGLPIWNLVDDRIEQYVIEKLRTDRDTARRVRMGFLARYGSTLRGLMRHHGVRPAEYLGYIHDVPVPEIVPRRPELLEMLSGLPGRCVVFTNGSKEYARRVLAALGVAERMEEVYGIEFMDYIAKPFHYPYRKLLRATDSRPEDSLFCEDSRRNLLPAHELGMFTVLVGGNGEEPPASREGNGPEELFRPHAVVGDVCDLPEVLHGFPPLARGRASG